MEITENSVRSGRTEINKKPAKEMGKDLFYETYKGKLSDPIDDVWSAINAEASVKDESKSKPASNKTGSRKPSHQDKLSDVMEKK